MLEVVLTMFVVLFAFLAGGLWIGWTLAVTGTVLVPRVRLFSEPDMSDAEKLSWLLRGRASEGPGSGDTALLQAAAMALLSGDEPSVLDNLFNVIGLDDLSVRQSDSASGGAIVSVGKQLSRNWYIGYERGLNATTGNRTVAKSEVAVKPPVESPITLPPSKDFSNEEGREALLMNFITVAEFVYDKMYGKSGQSNSKPSTLKLAGSLAWSNFFARLTHSHPGRVVWLVFNVLIAVLLMTLGVFEVLQRVLDFEPPF